jgi:hypothetical protein
MPLPLQRLARLTLLRPVGVLAPRLMPAARAVLVRALTLLLRLAASATETALAPKLLREWALAMSARRGRPAGLLLVLVLAPERVV